MAEGYTQSFDIYKFVRSSSQSTPIQVDNEQLSFDGQNDIEEFVLLSDNLTFYDVYNNVVGYYDIGDIYNYNNNYLHLDTVQWNGSNINEEERYSVPEWGGRFDVYYTGNFETDGTTITLSQSDLSLSVGETEYISASTNSSQIITWSSNNPAIATVSNAGNSATVTAVSAGTTTITASIGSESASCTVTVSAPSDYTLNIYDDTNTNIIKTITIPNGTLINKCIYDTGVYNEINGKDGYYISEWKNHDTGETIPDTQTMGGNLDIYPVYTEIKTKYYSAVSLPDLIQRFPFGAGSRYSLGDDGGEETVKLTSAQCALPSHSHAVLVDTNSDSPTYPKPYLPNGRYPGTEAHPLNQTTGSEIDYSKDNYNSYNSPVVYSASQPSADNPHNNMPPYLVVNFIIKYQ